MSGKLINELTALEIQDYLVSGKSSISQFYAQLMEFVAEGDKKIHAFVNFDAKCVKAQTQTLADDRDSGQEPGPLYGVPIGLKDIIDTSDFPTEYGSVIHQGRYAISNATLVRRLKEAGAVILGKTATTEFAAMHPAATCNPHNFEHSPGGSSSGSAAAVAAGFVPIAIGSQTNGSLIRPASYCGVYGFKPSRGLLPRSGVFEQSPSLDQMGVFARSLEDIALATEIMNGDDGFDEATKAVTPLRLVKTCQSEPPVAPKFCFFKTPWWNQIDPEAQEAYEAFIAHLGQGVITVLEMPEVVTKAVQWHRSVHLAELAFSLQKEYRHHPEQLSQTLRDQIKVGAEIPLFDYLTAKDRIVHVGNAFDEYFDHFDGILCPAALGTAPKGLGSTGDPIMQTVWSFAGLPTLSLPLLNCSNGLPLGVQMVGAYKNDGRLLRSARWLVHHFFSEETAQ
ncbi:MAG: amidase [Burkholderiaceae bacterium]